MHQIFWTTERETILVQPHVESGAYILCRAVSHFVSNENGGERCLAIVCRRTESAAPDQFMYV
jgi:hypothetical protein